jgi:hypothetical protein
VKININNVIKEHTEAIFEAITMCGDLAVGDPLTIDRKLKNMNISCIDRDKFFKTAEKFNEIFYKTNSSLSIQVISKDKIEVINSLANKVKEGSFDITEDEAWILLYALEHYARIGLGQFHHLDFLMSYLGFEFENYDEKEKVLQEMKSVFFPDFPSNASHGIFSDKVSEKVKVAWDIYQVIRYSLDLYRKVETFMLRTPAKASTNTCFAVIRIEGGNIYE